MVYPIMQRELTVHMHNSNWYLRLIEDEEKISGLVDSGWHRYNLYPDSFTFGEGWLAKQGMYDNLYRTGFQE
jgi:hypothetical protein